MKRVEDSESLNIRRGSTLERLKAARLEAEKEFGIRLSWPQFLEMILNRAEQVERKKKATT